MTDTRGRVAEMHHHTRRGLAVSGGFAIAAVASAVVPHETGVWLPLHLFFAGSLASAISTVTLLLAVTWSGAPAPARPAMTVQRWLLATGVVLVVVGREADARAVTAAGGVLAATALALAGALLTGVRRRTHTPRFDPAIDAYVLALAAGVVGVGLGIRLASTASSADVREAHLLLNVFGFVGVVVAATLPYFTATEARMRMSARATPARLRLTTVGLWLAAVGAAGAVAAERRDVAGAALGSAALAVVAVAAMLPRPRRRNLAWAGPRLVQLAAGLAWWAAMSGRAALESWRAESGIPGVERATMLALAIGGFGQILAASFAYLVPVVRGGGREALSSGFRRTRSWSGLAFGNLAAALALAGHTRPAAIAVGAWVLEATVRTATRPRPAP